MARVCRVCRLSSELRPWDSHSDWGAGIRYKLSSDRQLQEDPKEHSCSIRSSALPSYYGVCLTGNKPGIRPNKSVENIFLGLLPDVLEVNNLQHYNKSTCNRRMS